MSKIRTITQLQDSLDCEYSWRIKEIAALKSAAKLSTLLSQITIVRAGVPLLYAHWEGFVKQASKSYLNFVDNQRLTYKELESCFIVFGAKKHIEHITVSRAAKVNIEAVEFFIEKLSERANLRVSNAIDAESNLNAEVFSNIATSIGIDVNPYSTHFNFIDESLLKRRNTIAHGEYLDISSDDFRDLSDEIITLMRRYKNDLENAATMSSYKRKV